jgi:cytochrome c biogenesis protein CcmG, thiol:disulfide interchange protein DsbE
MKRSALTFCILFLATSLAQAQDLSKIDFRLRDVGGNERSFQELLKSIRGDESQPRKGALIISFWALWCEPCKQEMKALKPVYERMKEKNVHYLAINTDNPKSTAKVKQYVSTQALPYEHWLDPNSEIFKKLNGQSMPFSMIVDQNGKLIAKRVGFFAGDEKEIEADLIKTVE